MLLRLAVAPSTAVGERGAVLELLCRLCESSSLSKAAQLANQSMLLAAPCCWPQLLLDCMHLAAAPAGSPRASQRGGGGGSADAATAAVAAYRLLVVLLARGVAASPHGAQHLEACGLPGLLNASPERSFLCPDTAGGGPAAAAHAAAAPLAAVGPWQLLQAVLADVVLELLAAQAADTAGTSAAARGDGASPRASPRASSDWTMVSQVCVAWGWLGRCSSSGQQQLGLHRQGSSLLSGKAHYPSALLPAPVQWTTEPYVGNAAALLALLDDFLAGTALAPPGASLAPGGTALLWASGAVAEAGGSMPAAAWQELGAVPHSQQERFSSRLLLAAWRFLDRVHGSGAAAAAAAEATSPLAPAALGSSGAGGEGAAGAVPGMSTQQLAALRQQRGLLLLQRLLLYCLQHATPEMAQQAAAQAAQLLPLLLADAAVDAAAAEAAAPRLQLLLAAIVQCYRTLASRVAAAQRESLSLLPQEQRVAACQAAANAVVDASPHAFGLQPSTPPGQQQLGAAQPPAPRRQSEQQRERSLQELLPLLQPRVVVSAAATAVLFMRHCSGQHEAAAPALQAQLQAAAEHRTALVAAAGEDCQQCLGRLRAADRLRRAAGRQAADEAAQQRQRQWRDLRRALTSGRGLWADEEQPEGERACRLLCCSVRARCCCCAAPLTHPPAQAAKQAATTLHATLPPELHWKLDEVEDPSRRRLRLCRNYHWQRYADEVRGSAASSSAALAGAGAAAAGGGAGSEEEPLSVVPGTNPDAVVEAEPGSSSDEEEQEAASQQQEGDGLHTQTSRSGSAAATPKAAELEAAGEGSPRLPGTPKADVLPPANPPLPAERQQGTAAPVPEPPPPAAAAAAPPASQLEQQCAEERPQGAPQAALQPATTEDLEAAAAAMPAAEALYVGRCQWVTPKRVVPGQLQISRSRMVFLADPPGSSGGGLGGLSTWPPGPAGDAAGGDAVPAAAAAAEGEEGRPRRRRREWPLSGLTEVHHSRYLLQPTAFECFSADRCSHALFNFPSHQVRLAGVGTAGSVGLSRRCRQHASQLP